MVSSKCFVPGCKTGYKNKENADGRKYSLFGPPRDADLLVKWKLAIRRKDRELTENDRVCELHFAEDDIERFYITKLPNGVVEKFQRGRLALKNGAVPTQFPHLPLYFGKNSKKINRNAVSNNKESPIKEVATVDKNVDPILFKMWDIDINEQDKQLSTTDSVCELHFQDNVQRYYVTRLADGSIHTIEKVKPSLKSIVHPSILPDDQVTTIKNLPKISTHIDNSFVSLLPKNKNTYSRNTVSEFSLEGYTDETQTCKTDFEKFSEIVKEGTNVNLIQKIFESITSNIDNDNTYVQVNVDENFSYEKLCGSLIMIQKPNDWWCITTSPKYVVCAKWNLNHIAEKTIIIDENLITKVYLREREIVIPALTKVTSVNDVSTLLRRVEGFKICAGVNRFKGCLVCLLGDKRNELLRKWCRPCKISLKKEYNDKRPRTITKAEREERRKMKLDCERHKNKRLLNKVNNLRHRLQIYEKMCPSIKSEVNKLSSMFITTESAQNSINTTNLEDENSSGSIECDMLDN